MYVSNDATKSSSIELLDKILTVAETFHCFLLVANLIIQIAMSYYTHLAST